MYTYKATVDRIVDGDTFEVTIDLGFFIYHKMTIRPLGYDAPETWRPTNNEEKMHGEEATTFVQNLFSAVDYITITTEEEDSFGRWLAWVRLPDGEKLERLMEQRDLLKRDSYE